MQWLAKLLAGRLLRKPLVLLVASLGLAVTLNACALSLERVPKPSGSWSNRQVFVTCGPGLTPLAASEQSAGLSGLVSEPVAVDVDQKETD